MAGLTALLLLFMYRSQGRTGDNADCVNWTRKMRTNAGPSVPFDDISLLPVLLASPHLLKRDAGNEPLGQWTRGGPGHHLLFYFIFIFYFYRCFLVICTSDLCFLLVSLRMGACLLFSFPLSLFAQLYFMGPLVRNDCPALSLAGAPLALPGPDQDQGAPHG